MQIESSRASSDHQLDNPIPALDRPGVSIIIPAYNAAETVEKTLDSLQAQTVRRWEGIIVDDGSTDSTGEIIARHAAEDSRLRVISQPNAGVSAARNTGIADAQYDWLLFLDADDWMTPNALEELTNAVIADNTLGAVHCGWTVVTPDGQLIEECTGVHAGDMFPIFAMNDAFVIHACLVRRALVNDAGGFDTSLTTCEEWDLWQRIARTGAKFGAVRLSLARYRVRAGSASTDDSRVLADALRVVETGHSADPRVTRPAPEHMNGLDKKGLPLARLCSTCWIAGSGIGRGDDPRPMLDVLGTETYPDLEVEWLAHTLYLIVPRTALQPAAAWDSLWREHSPMIAAFLRALEEKTRSPLLAERAKRALERRILELSALPLPAVIGKSMAVKIAADLPFQTVSAPDGVEILIAHVEFDGEAIGKIQLPVFGGVVPASVLSDAIAAEFAWTLLSRYFERSLAGTITVTEGPDGVTLSRRDGPLQDVPAETAAARYRDVHDQVGWVAFLQEFWGCKDWPQSAFYDAQYSKSGPETPLAITHSTGEWISIDAGDQIPDILSDEQEVNVLFSVGGVPLAVETLSTTGGRIRSQQIRAAVTLSTGMELCHAAVREAILGAPVNDKSSLRARLTEAAMRRQKRKSNAKPALCPDMEPIPGCEDALERARSDGNGAVVARRRPGEVCTSASRRAVLPAIAAADLAASAGYGDIVISGKDDLRPGRNAIYAPDVFSRASVSSAQARAGSYNNPTERLKGGQTLDMAGPGGITAKLASHVESVVAAVAKAGALFRPKQAATPSRQSAAQVVPVELKTTSLPILMYHSIAPEGPSAVSRYRVTPEAFEHQLGYLRDCGFRSARVDEWGAAIVQRVPLPGRRILLTFDCGFLDFETYAWPLLQRFGYSALIFLVADAVGSANMWDAAYGETAPLLDWDRILRLQDEGVEFGSHSLSHPFLTGIPVEAAAHEAARSRIAISDRLGRPVTAFAYPHGDCSRATEHVIGACGYEFGLTGGYCRSQFTDRLLNLPRMEITGSDSLEDFALKIAE